MPSSHQSFGTLMTSELGPVKAGQASPASAVDELGIGPHGDMASAGSISKTASGRNCSGTATGVFCFSEGVAASGARAPLGGSATSMAEASTFVTTSPVSLEEAFASMAGVSTGVTTSPVSLAEAFASMAEASSGAATSLAPSAGAVALTPATSSGAMTASTLPAATPSACGGKSPAGAFVTQVLLLVRSVFCAGRCEALAGIWLEAQPIAKDSDD
mmetsp:Transcript_78831/g.219142  ORF Transcript_78831/g.219142 Transcript_78831/m.219142 type:complete len:216 (-) Transcript_78831:114-761(-)